MAATKSSRYYAYIRPVIEHHFVKSFAPYIFSLLTITIFIFLAIRPTVATIVSLQKSIDDNKQVLDALNKKAQNLTEGKKNLESMDTATKNKIIMAIPEQTSVPALIGSLQTASLNQASVSALQVQPLTLFDNNIPKQKAAVLGEIQFSFSLQGSFAQLLATLTNLSRTARLVSIDNITLSKPTDSPAILSITGKGFYLK